MVAMTKLMGQVAFLVAFFASDIRTNRQSKALYYSLEYLITRRLVIRRCPATFASQSETKQADDEHRSGRKSVSAPSHEQRFSGTARSATDRLSYQWATSDDLRSGRTAFRLPARSVKTRLGLLSRNQKEALVALLLSLTVSFPWGNRSAK